MKIKNVGKVIKNRRMLLEMDKVTLGRITGLGVMCIDDVERGQGFILAESLIKLCKVLGLNIYDFIEEEDPVVLKFEKENGIKPCIGTDPNCCNSAGCFKNGGECQKTSNPKYYL